MSIDWKSYPCGDVFDELIVEGHARPHAKNLLDYLAEMSWQPARRRRTWP